MVGKNTAVFGIYPNRAEVEEAVETLKSAGFRSADISVLLPQNLGTKDLAHEKSSKAPEGAVTGAGTGAVIGGALGWLVGIGAIMIPGLGPFLAAGPLVSALAGLGAGGTVGGLTGALIGSGVPEYEAKRYDGRLRKGGILLSVHCDDSDWAANAKEILQRTGAEDIAATGEARADFAVGDKPSPRMAPEFRDEERYRPVGMPPVETARLHDETVIEEEDVEPPIRETDRDDRRRSKEQS